MGWLYSLTEDELAAVLEEVLGWAYEKSGFDPGFLESIQKDLEDTGGLTDRQLEGLGNIIERWNIPVR